MSRPHPRHPQGHPQSTLHRPRWAADLLQLLAAWLVLILLLQGLQGAITLVMGPRHQHAAAQAPTSLHAHSHEGMEQHFHRLDDGTVEHAAADEGALDAAQLALSLALSCLLFGTLQPRRPNSRAVLQDGKRWFWRHRTVQPPLRPPRAG